MNATELKSLVYAKLISRGLTVRMNYRVKLSPSVRGFSQVNLDIVALDHKGVPFVALCIGPRKDRKLLKYKLAKVQFFELADEEKSPEVLEKFIGVYINKFY